LVKALTGNDISWLGIPFSSHSDRTRSHVHWRCCKGYILGKGGDLRASQR
jgi:hypothetical protein